MITISSIHLENLCNCTKYKSKIEDVNKIALGKLNKIKLKDCETPQIRDYLRKVKTMFKTVSLVSPSFQEYNNILNIEKIPKNGREISCIRNKIKEALDYSKHRDLFREIFQDLGIKSCVYCNSQMSVYFDVKGRKKAQYQIDHFYPQGTYPHLSICIFNLLPACYSCNNIKNKSAYSFYPYSATLDYDNFKFSVPISSISKYLTSNNINDLVIEFKHDSSKLNNFKDILGIEAIYNTQKDLVAEMLDKKRIYNQNHINNLKKLCEDNNISESQLKRIIVGNYTEPHEIHKRPMSKFMQDVAKDLDLI